MKTRWPSHAYVPGQTLRHPEGTFDDIRETVEAGMSPAALAQTAAFRHGLLYLDAGYSWEAHEVLEPVWVALPEPSIERRFVQGLIQLANGCLKLQMGRPKAALRLSAIARELLSTPAGDVVLTVERGEVLARVESLACAAKSAI